MYVPSCKQKFLYTVLSRSFDYNFKVWVVQLSPIVHSFVSVVAEICCNVKQLQMAKVFCRFLLLLLLGLMLLLLLLLLWLLNFL